MRRVFTDGGGKYKCFTKILVENTLVTLELVNDLAEHKFESVSRKISVNVRMFLTEPATVASAGASASLKSSKLSQVHHGPGLPEQPDWAEY